jgi:hypothetical protein
MVTHKIGSRLWESWLKGFKAFDALTEKRYLLRVEESQAHPQDTDLARRADLLGRELVFEKTGEVLPHPTEARRSDERRHAAVYLCPLCKATEQAAGRFVRADVMPGSKHFGALIPCPKCCPQAHGAYVLAHGAVLNRTPEMVRTGATDARR